MRFTRSPTQILGSKLFGRREVNSRLSAEGALDRGGFLGKLWALFGAPSPRHGGFEYYLRDRETQLDFTAYAGPRGCSYGGDLEQRNALRRVVEALEEMLEQVQPVDCAIEYMNDIELGGGQWVVGCKDGRTFDLPDRRYRVASNHVERRSQRAR